MNKGGKTQLPGFLKPYFWDVKFENLDLDKKPTFILKRIIDRGDTKSLQWATKQFDLHDIRLLILSSRDLSRKTANFWAEMLDIDKKEVLCLQKPYSRIPFGLSN